MKTYRIETLILGKWVVASRGVHAVEAESIRNSRPSDTSVRFIPDSAAEKVLIDPDHHDVFPNGRSGCKATVKSTP